MRRSKKPKEDPSVIAFRERQVRDLSRLDEEENRRIKQALFPRNRIFRRRSGDSSGGSVRSSAGRTVLAANVRDSKSSGESQR